MKVEESDLVLRPDLSTMCILPWRSTEGRVMQFFCDVEKPDSAPFGGNCRGFLREMNRRFRKLGLTCNVGAECEFYLFENDDRGRPTRIPIDFGGYFDVAPLDAGENSLFSLSDPDDAFAPCLGWGPGVSGCSLKSVIAAASLLQWAEGARMSSRSPEAIQEAFYSWYDGLTDNQQEGFAEAWPLVKDAALDLLSDKDSMTDRIADAGLLSLIHI